MEIRVNPKLLHEFHAKVAMPLRLPETSRRLLREFAGLDVKAEDVARAVQRNQYVESLLLGEIKALGLKENTPKIAGAIALLGMQRARDFVHALQIMRTVERRHPKRGKDGKLEMKAANYLKYAMRAEEFASSRRLQHVNFAYAAGLMFDVVVASGRAFFGAGKPFEELADEVFRHGLRTGTLGVEIAKSFKGFSYTRFAFAGCLIHDVGKLAMELLHPGGATLSYAVFRTDLAKKPVSRDVRMFIEASRFGLTHEHYGAQMAHHFDSFRSIEKAILFHHEPYLIRKENKDTYAFAALIALASNMASSSVWLTPELKDFKIDPGLLASIAQKVALDKPRD